MSGGFMSSLASALSFGFSGQAGTPGSTLSCQAPPPPDPTDPCFIQSLELVAYTQTFDKGEYEKKHTQTVKYVHGTDAGLPQNVKDLLGQDELLLQTVSGDRAQDGEGGGGTPGSLEVTAVTTPACGLGDHPDNAIYDESDQNQLTEFGAGKQTFQLLSTTPPAIFDIDTGMEVARVGTEAGGMATGLILGTAYTASTFNSAGIWAQIWPFSDKSHRTYIVEVPACGLHTNPAIAAPDLVTARIEVFRKRSAMLKLALPAASTRSYTGEVYVNTATGEAVASYAEKRTDRFGAEESGLTVEVGESPSGSHRVETSTTETRDGVIITRKSADITTEGPGNTWSVEEKDSETHTRANALFSRQITAEESQRKIGEDFIVQENTTMFGSDNVSKFEEFDTRDPEQNQARNTQFDADRVETEMASSVQYIVDGREVDLHVLGNLMALPRRFEETLKDLQDMVPKIGFSYGLDMSFFTASLEIETQLGPAEAGLHDRVWLADRYATVKASGELINIQASVGFGIDITVKNHVTGGNVFALVAKAELIFTIVASVDVNWDSRHTAEVEPEFHCDPELAGQLVGEATLFGFGYKATAKLSGGFSFEVTARFTREPGRENKLDGDASYTGVILLLQVMENGKSIYEYQKKVGEEKPVWRGAIIGRASSSSDAAAASATAAAGVQ